MGGVRRPKRPACWRWRAGRSPSFDDPAAAAEIGWLVELVGAIRSVRSEMNVPAAARTPLVALGGDSRCRNALARARGRDRADGPHRRDRRRREGAPKARRRSSSAARPSPCRSPASSISPPSGRGSRRKSPRVEGEIARIDKKLANENFVARAPEEVVEAEREKRAAYAADGERLAAALKRVKEAA